MNEHQKRFSHEFAKETPNFLLGKGEPADRALNKMLLSLIGLLFFACSEATRVLLRTSWGKKGISYSWLWIALIFFTAIAAIEVFRRDATGADLVSAFFLVTQGISFLLKAIADTDKDDETDFKGFTIGDNEKLWTYLYEPLFMIGIGLIYGFGFMLFSKQFNWFMFFAYSFCGISVYFESFLKEMFELTSSSGVEQQVAKNNEKLNPASSSNEVVIPD